MAFRSGNPILTDKAFDQQVGATSDRMTLDGTVNKTGLLLLIAVLSAAWPWSVVMQQGQAGAGMVGTLAMGGAIIGLILALIISFKPHTAPYLAPVYAVVEGVFLGAVSGFFELRFPGIVLQAIALTFGTLGALLLAYKSGLIRATENFKLGIVAATGAIFLLYLVSFVLSFFGIQIPLIHGSGWVGIAFSLFVVTIAALNLVLDFDFIENGVAAGAPKYMEWYGAFGLVVTLFWLYLEFLRLLAKLRE
jgi:uncharacterized YccA/Bax inhibitor family protein